MNEHKDMWKKAYEETDKSNRAKDIPLPNHWFKQELIFAGKSEKKSS